MGLIPVNMKIFQEPLEILNHWKNNIPVKSTIPPQTLHRPATAPAFPGTAPPGATRAAAASARRWPGGPSAGGSVGNRWKIHGNLREMTGTN